MGEGWRQIWTWTWNWISEALEVIQFYKSPIAAYGQSFRARSTWGRKKQKETQMLLPQPFSTDTHSGYGVQAQPSITQNITQNQPSIQELLPELEQKTLSPVYIDSNDPG
jgi:hypothetical protein